MAHENGKKQRLAKRRHVQGMLDKTDPLNSKSKIPSSYRSFDIVGYGCMTCIGNSGPLPEPVAEAIERVFVISAFDFFFVNEFQEIATYCIH